MIILLTIILASAFAIMAVFGMIYCESECVNNDVYGSITLTIGVIAFISSIFTIKEVQIPSAIDVYRGKTTLEITYKGGIPIDTVVVFKERK